MKNNKTLIKLIRHFAVYLVILTSLTWVIGIPSIIGDYKILFADPHNRFGTILYFLVSLKGILRSLLIVGSIFIGTQILLMLAKKQKKLRSNLIK